MLRFWFALITDDPWLALTGLTVVLIVLLGSGVLLLVFGAWDLIQDFRHALRERSHKNSHA